MFYGRPRISLSYQASKMSLCGRNNLFQDSLEDIADGIAEIAKAFQSSYNSIKIAIGGILPRDASWSVKRVLMKGSTKF